jgi:REP-associated tyrosine transposase
MTISAERFVHSVEFVGYRAFTVSQSNVDEVRRYIAKQKEHHQKVSFRDEFVQFLKANGIEYDERYI